MLNVRSLTLAFLLILLAAPGITQKYTAQLPTHSSARLLEGTFSGLDYKIAEVTTTFSDTLYIPQGAACPYCDINATYANTTCICDYSVKATCPTLNNPNCPPCSTRTGSVDPCIAPTWNTVQFDVPFDITVYPSSTSLSAVRGTNTPYRIYNDQPCTALWLEVNATESIFNIDMYNPEHSNRAGTDSRAPWMRTFQEGSYSYVCPTHLWLNNKFNPKPDFWVPGTVEFVFKLPSGISSVPATATVTMRRIAIRRKPSTPILTTCGTTPTPGNLTCISDKVDYDFPNMTSTVFAYKITGCRTVSFLLRSLDGNNYAFITRDTTDLNVTNPERTIWQNAFGSRKFTQTFCAKSSSDFMFLLIKISMREPDDFAKFTVDSIPSLKAPGISPYNPLFRLEPIHTLSQYGAKHDLFAVANMSTPYETLRCRPFGNVVSNSAGYDCDRFSPSHPAMSTPFIPTPEWLLRYYRSTGTSSFLAPLSGALGVTNFTKVIDLFASPPTPTKSFRSYVILDFETGPTNVTFLMNMTTLTQSYINFTGIMTDSQGLPISGLVPIKEQDFIPCVRSDYERFYQLFTDAMDNFTQMTTGTDVAAQRYYTESLFTLPGYHECNSELKVFQVPAPPVEYSLLICNKTREDPGYPFDPCCDPTAAWTGVCDRPKIITLPAYSVAEDTVRANCARPDCIDTFLGDYFNSKKGIGCPSALAQSTSIDSYLIDTFRNCFTSVYGSTSLGSHGRGSGNRCYADSDCPEGIQCDMQWRICPIYNQTQLDNQFLLCVVNSFYPEEIVALGAFFYSENVTMPSSLTSTFQRGNFSSINWSSVDGQNYLLSLILSNGDLNADTRCDNPVGISGWSVNWKEKRTFFSAYLFANGLQGPISYSATFDPVFYLEYPETTNLDADLNGVFLTENAVCTGAYSCINNNVACGANCNVSCAVGTYFCMLCRDSQTCIDIPGITSQQECEAAKACYKPNNYGLQATPILNITAEECLNESHQFCTQPCGLTCGQLNFGVDALKNDSGYCYNPNINSSAACIGGTYSNTKQTCYYNLNRVDCLSVTGRVHTGGLTCDTMLPSLDECQRCQGKGCNDIRAWYMGCGVTYKQCPDKASCLSSAGNCTGAFPPLMSQLTTTIYSPKNVALPPRNFGACLFPKLPVNDLPNGCDFNRSQFVFGKFCVDFNYTVPTTCETAGGEWYVPPTEEETCTSEKWWGCWEQLPNTQLSNPLRRLSFNGFSPKTKEECLSIHNKNYPFAVWKPMFRWVKPEWRNSTVRQPVWKARELVQRTVPKKGWRFDGFYSIARNILSTSRLTINSKAEIICRSSANVDILQFSTCACYSNGDANSFDQCLSSTSSIAAATNRLCPGSLIGPLPADKVEVSTNQTSLTTGTFCSNLQVFALPANNFKAPEQLTLASSLVKLNQYAPFDITNENGATIGTILASGITVVSEIQLNHYSVCFLSTSQNKAVPEGQIMDLARVEGTKLVPMDLNTIPDDLERTCFAVASPPTNSSWVLVSHIPNWKEKELEYFPRSTVILLYILAVFFLIATIFCIMAWVSYFFTASEGNFGHQTFFTILFTFLFCIIRCVYFFMLPRGLSSQSADYVLIVLPTFFYFSSVLQLITTWVALATLSLTKLSRATKFTNIAALIIHILLYIIFLIIVLLFHFNQPQSTPSCGNRIIYSPDYSTQRKLSLAYAIIIAIFSVFLGVGFLAFGLKTVTKFKKSLSDGVKKVAFTTGIYAGAFVLHCIYVFLLIIVDPSIVFVFVGFTITEVIPAMYLMVNHIQYRKVIAAVASATAKSRNTTKSKSKEGSKIQMSSVATSDLPE